MRILLTGGAGFVGSSLAIYLKNKFIQYEIIVLDNLKRRGSEMNLLRFQKLGIQFIHGDVRNMDDLNSVSNIDFIIDCSAEPSVMAEQGPGVNYLISTNLVGTLNCLNLAKREQAKFLFLSTSRVYPIQRINNLKFVEKETRFELAKNNDELGVSLRGFSEDLSTDGYRTLYGTTKLSSEYFIEEFAQLFGIKAIVNRCGLIAGPGQFGKVDQGVITSWVTRHMWKQELAYIGYGGFGKQVRDVLNILDLCEIVLHQIFNIDSLAGKTFNLGGGPENSTSLLELTKICSEITGNELKVLQRLEERPGDLIYYVTDCSNVKNQTNWWPKKTVEQTVQDIFDWVRSNEKKLKNVIG